MTISAPGISNTVLKDGFWYDVPDDLAIAWWKAFNLASYGPRRRRKGELRRDPKEFRKLLNAAWRIIDAMIELNERMDAFDEVERTRKLFALSDAELHAQFGAELARWDAIFAEHGVPIDAGTVH